MLEQKCDAVKHFLKSGDKVKSKDCVKLNGTWGDFFPAGTEGILLFAPGLNTLQIEFTGETNSGDIKTASVTVPADAVVLL